MQEIKTSTIAMDEFVFQGQPSVIQIKNKQTDQSESRSPRYNTLR